METFRGSERADGKTQGCVLTIGNFDGLHLGHRALLDAVARSARTDGRRTAVYTFDRHPRRVLQPAVDLPRLMSSAQLEWALAAAGVDILIVEPFTPELAGLSAEAFMQQVLIGRISPSEVVVGRDFRFGQGRSGSDATLQEHLPDAGIQVEVIPQVLVEGEDVSSTRIRTLLQEGRVEEVARCLGRPYALWAQVVAGESRGRQLGFPTANLLPEDQQVPARGVYATTVRVLGAQGPEGPTHRSVTNVGTRPTFEEGRLLTETHLLDFEGDLYGRALAVEFRALLREERRFSGPDELRAQIERDVDAARRQLERA